MKFHFGEIEWYCMVLFILTQSHCRHYTSAVNVDKIWFLISDTRILRQQKLQCSSKGISGLYILIYERITNFLTALWISSNVTAEAGPTSELITETAETMIQQSVLQELKKTESKINYCSGFRKKRKPIQAVKYPGKWESKFKKHRCKKMIKRGRDWCVLTPMMKKSILKKEDNKRKK